MNKKMMLPVLGGIFKKLAPRLGAKVIIEPTWGIVGQVSFPNGRKRYFRYTSVDLNTLGASDIAQDKDYANFFLAKMGYPVIPGEAFYSCAWAAAIGSRRDIDAAYRYAKQIGFPVMVKPNSGSQGAHVRRVDNKKEFYSALRRIFRDDRIALVQRIVRGQDYRIVVLDDKVISAYERTPFHITGDGIATAGSLIKNKLKRLAADDRPANITSADPRLLQNLRRAGFSLGSVLPRGRQIALLDNANLSTGGDSVDVTPLISPAFKKLAIKITRDMGLRLCGVDLMVDGDIRRAPGKYWVIEINAAPGLDHYIKTGPAQQKIVEDMYLKVLQAMGK